MKSRWLAANLKKPPPPSMPNAGAPDIKPLVPANNVIMPDKPISMKACPGQKWTRINPKLNRLMEPSNPLLTFNPMRNQNPSVPTSTARLRQMR